MHAPSEPNSSTTSIQSNSHFSLSPSYGLFHASVSKLAQESLREVKHLRILLTRLLGTVEFNEDDSFDDDTDQLVEDKYGRRISDAKPTTPSGYPLDFKFPLGSTDNRLLTESCNNGLLNLPKLAAQISETLETLDQLAGRFQMNRLSNRFGELGVLNALNMLTTMDQLDFSGSGDYGDSVEASDNGLRRADWLADRTDAERWSTRYWERTHTVMEGLLSCSVFRRSHLNSDLKRNRIDSWSNSARDFRADLEHLLSDVQYGCPRLSFALFDSGSTLLVAHVKIGDVMQCLVTFRRLHPETLIIRGLTECVYVKPSVPTDVEDTPVSKSMEELLCSKLDSPVKELLVSLANPDARAGAPSHDARMKRSGLQHRPINVSSINIQQLDLITPSRFGIFQRITSLARCALLHFSNEYQPPSAVRGLFVWLHSYHDLFTAPCVRCGRLLGQDVTLPVWRTYPQLRKDDIRAMEAQHEHCQAVS